MKLHTDRQTLSDLNVTDSLYGEKTLFSLFKSTSSEGGKRVLEEWVSTPLRDLQAIQQRMEAIRANIPTIHIDWEELDFIEFYLSQNDKPTRFSFFESFFMMLFRKFRKEPQRYIVSRGSQLLTKQLSKLISFASSITEGAPPLIHSFAQTVQEAFSMTQLQEVFGQKEKQINAVDFRDYLYRYKNSGLISELLNIIYQLDVIQTVHRIALERDYCFPEMTAGGALHLSGFYHPHLEQPVKNDWEMDGGNICLITGSNMAGKSTTMRAVASAVWLAHAGLPVPASSMTCPVFNGIFTSINLPDSMKDGRSHFYAEVLRIKEVLEEIEREGNCFVLFDEMFRGTNARDAFEASVAVVDLLELKAGSLFLISTHIIELAQHFHHAPSCCFYYMESKIENDSLLCHYRLKEGVSESRVGAWIVKKELSYFISSGSV